MSTHLLISSFVNAGCLTVKGSYCRFEKACSHLKSMLHNEPCQWGHPVSYNVDSLYFILFVYPDFFILKSLVKMNCFLLNSVSPDNIKLKHDFSTFPNSVWHLAFLHFSPDKFFHKSYSECTSGRTCQYTLNGWAAEERFPDKLSERAERQRLTMYTSLQLFNSSEVRREACQWSGNMMYSIYT